MNPDFEGYARAMLDQRIDGAFSDIDGGELQEIAAEYGILVEVDAPQPCAEFGCNCEAAGADFPAICYRPWDWNEAKETT